MKRLRLVVLMIMAVLSLGALAAASASATERGVLLLEKEAGPVTMKGEGEITAELAITGAPAPIVCKKLTLLEVSLTSPGSTHFNLGKDSKLHFAGCKLLEVACNSVGDEKEIILVLADLHLINLEEKKGTETILRPGFAVLILNAKLELGILELKCGVTTIEVRGTSMGTVEPLNAKKEITLKEDVTDADLTATKVICDKTEEKVCQELLEKDPLQGNLGAGWVTATEATTPFLVTVSPMVIWDD